MAIYVHEEVKKAGISSARAVYVEELVFVENPTFFKTCGTNRVVQLQLLHILGVGYGGNNAES